MSSEADSVTVALKLVTERDERLNITSTTDNLDDDVQANLPFGLLSIGGRSNADRPVEI